MIFPAEFLPDLFYDPLPVVAYDVKNKHGKGYNIGITDVRQDLPVSQKEDYKKNKREIFNFRQKTA